MVNEHVRTSVLENTAENETLDFINVNDGLPGQLTSVTRVNFATPGRKLLSKKSKSDMAKFINDGKDPQRHAERPKTVFTKPLSYQGRRLTTK